MKHLIINADDCGLSCRVNKGIEEAIMAGIISSTTIMANMDDFEGAVRLYKEYKNRISFGWHINLTEGESLIRSQILLDKGFLKEINGKVLFNGQSFRKKLITGEMAREIRRELVAQWEKLHDNGIEITHVDSHHHIHTTWSMLFIMPSLFNELRISRCRHLKNYGVTGTDYICRQLWALPFKMYGIRMTETMGDFATYYKNSTLRQGKTIELECHPGHPNPKYQTEMELLNSTDFSDWNASLITYKEI